MKRRNTVAAAATDRRPSRLLVALAAAWMILSLAIGAAVSADPRPEAIAPAPITGITSQP